MKLKIGNSVIVKPGIKDPDLDICIEGWQGRVSEINDDNICIDWDSITLKQMSAPVIIKCEQNGWGWNQMYLGISDVQLTKPRDTIEDVEAVFSELQDKYAWVYLGEEGERIQTVLSGISPDNDWSSFEAWKKFLDEEFKFPFKATVEEFQERGPLQSGDKINVYEIDELIDEMYGIRVKVSHKKFKYVFPLADIEVTDKKSKNYQPVKDYAIWYANR